VLFKLVLLNDVLELAVKLLYYGQLKLTTNVVQIILWVHLLIIQTILFLTLKFIATLFVNFANELQVHPLDPLVYQREISLEIFDRRVQPQNLLKLVVVNDVNNRRTVCAANELLIFFKNLFQFRENLSGQLQQVAVPFVERAFFLPKGFGSHNEPDKPLRGWSKYSLEPLQVHVDESFALGGENLLQIGLRLEQVVELHYVTA
jgi:hypothetical protein